MFEPIAELAEINPPLRAPTPDRPEAPISFIPMGDVSESGQWLARQTRPLREVKSGFTPFQEGDVLFAKITPCMENGKGAHAVGLENGVGYGSTEFHVLRAKADNSPRYIFHLSQSPNLRLKAEASMIGSAGQKRVPTDFFRKHRVFAPDRAEQQLVAHILDTLDTQIQKTDALIAKLEKVKEGLLHDLLTRGIDESGRLRPSPEQAPELYKESPLGLIPREWSVGSLGNLSEIVSGVTLGGKSGSSDWPLVPYLRVANVQDGYLDLTDIKRIKVGPADIDKYRLLPGDVLMNEGGDFDKLGRGALWQGQIELCLHQNHVFRVRTNPGMLSPHFLTAFSSSVAGKHYFIRSSKQSTNLASINSTQLKAFQVPLPSSAEQMLIVKELQAMASKIESEKDFLDKMLIQKSGLMDDLLTGRVRVTPLLDQAQATTPA
ncbi:MULTISPECIES: restriction endonuclease subunit S [unclassified Halomonas]|uniref:restriction endonuclease subunit S n=1 Tax=unclassified Halomonas TaxID=2609666 RepID=UPI0024691237|nr:MULTISPECIES: restriction endonuclease subunit S [unclassified Halomonas]